MPANESTHVNLGAALFTALLIGSAYFSNEWFHDDVLNCDFGIRQ